MKKYTLSFVLFLFVFANLFSQQRNENDAFLTAKTFFAKRNKLRSDRSVDPAVVLSYKAFFSEKQKTTKQSNVSYYVFNVGDNDGFVIVSGDKRAKDILGYSDDGAFEIDKISDNFRSWLSGYEQEMKYLSTQDTGANQNVEIGNNSHLEKTFASSINPLLRNIKWNQDTPYNNLCPIIVASTGERAAVGCVATAMAQIMKYHQWPDVGVGSNSYKTNTLKLDVSADFSLSPYDWANMTDGYHRQSTEKEKKAVATLMYHCGVSVNMDYGYSSTAFSYNIANALIRNFKYDSNIQMYKREFYSQSEWIEMIKSELNAGRPIFYRGDSKDVGHIFVCDGYDTQGLFHFNWGWSGMSDGYFELSALNPLSLGIGGGSSSGFNYDQAIIIGVQRPGVTTIPESYLLHFGGILSAYPVLLSRTDVFTLDAGVLLNHGVNQFTCDYGVGLFDLSDNLVEVLCKTNVKLNANMMTDGPSGVFNNLRIPASVSDGNYKLRPIYKIEGQSDWRFMRGKVGKPQYLDVNVASDAINILSPNVMPHLILNSIKANKTLYKGKKASVDINLTNSGGEYNSKLRLLLKSTTGSIVQDLTADAVNIAEGETKTIRFTTNSIVVAAGNYNFVLMYDPKNDSGTSLSQYKEFPVRFSVKVLDAPTQIPNLTLLSAISFADKNAVSRDSICLSATIKNTGGFFDGTIIAYIYNKNATGSPLAQIGKQLLFLDKNETENVTFEGNTTLIPDEYLIEIRYYSNDAWRNFIPSINSYLSFRLIEGTTGIRDTQFDNGLTVYPNPVNGVLYINSTENNSISKVRVLDLYGRPILLSSPMTSGIITVSVDNLPQGAYILQIETEKGLNTSKFIKQ